MKIGLSVFLVFWASTSFAQWHLGVFAGGASYMGDLNDKVFQRTKPALGLSVNYDITERFSLRSGFTWGRIEGADRFSGSTYLQQVRNLSFESHITELSLLGELTVFNLNSIRWSPYAFAGISVYRFNPFARDSGNRKVFLQPLGTEGQGLSQYPDRKPYSLTQFAIPFGGGIKYSLSDNVRIGLELGLRRLFTDYLDDVSRNYADEMALSASRGPEAVRFAYRGGEVPGETDTYPDTGYPTKDAQRGNPNARDWFYFTGIHLTFRLGGGYGKTDASGKAKGYGCPGNPM